MDVSAEVDAIVAQAPEWNFAGDCALLDLMKRISQNLHEQGEKTSQTLKEFEANVRRADIALDNATNSLRSLQFGQQFVEYRVEEVDDDDFVLPEEQTKKPEPPVKSSQELAKEFLQNNLQMFRKNFEAVTIEVPDSDDEDSAVHATTVFRDKNPYDAIPLPYIIGSKEWQEHKYAGLYDSAENSEEEQTEQFSSSSSDEQETGSPQATPGDQSNSSSLASLPKAQPVPSPAISTPRHSVESMVLPKAQPRPIISSMQRNPHERDLFSAMRASPPSDDPPSSSSSLNSSPAVSHRNAAAMGHPRANASLSSSSSSVSRVIQAGRQSPPKPFEDEVPVVANPPAVIPALPPSEVKPVAAASQIKRKPVNLFNDDEFNSFMSEIVDKVHSKSGNSVKPAVTMPQPNELPKQTAPPAQPEVKPQTIVKPKPRTNLFDDSPPPSPKRAPASTPVPTPAPAPAAKPAKPALTKSLFDDSLEDEVDDFLSSIATKPKPKPHVLKSSLFFDDDDDVDIDDIFAKKTPSVQPPKATSTSIAKSSLFNDDDEDDVKDIFGKVENKETLPVPAPTVKPPSTQRKSLFDDDDDLFATPKSNKPAYSGQEKKGEAKEQAPPLETIVQPVQEEQKPPMEEVESRDLLDKATLPVPKADLFSDDFSDEEAVAVAAKPTRDSREILAVKEPTNKPKREQQPETEVEPPIKQEEPAAAQPVPEKVQSAAKQEELAEVLPDFEDEEAPADNQEGLAEALPDFDEVQPSAGKQDPIISMVAELSQGKHKKETPVRTAADVEAAQKIVQNYSNLFSDEPPDDSEFFQSLGTSSLSSLSASKMFDSEQDFYEPSLPDLPQSAAAADQSSKDYGGMHLFSDVPPDDDEQEQVVPPVASTSQQKSSQQPEEPKRIHTIFYDDFSETTRASSVKPARADAVFDETPPVDLPKPSSPIKKLQMPNININVQALLPGAGGLPKLPKKLEEPVALAASVPVSPSEPAAATQLPAVPSQLPKETGNGTENILQCVGKTRVRGPAHRRPSTRRARQANYAKSVLESETEASQAANPTSKPTNPVRSTDLPSFESDDNEQSADDSLFKAFGAASTKTASKASVKKATLFLDSDGEEDDDLYGKVLQRKAAAVSAAAPVAPKKAVSPTAPAVASAVSKEEFSPPVTPMVTPVTSETMLPTKKPTVHVKPDDAPVVVRKDVADGPPSAPAVAASKEEASPAVTPMVTPETSKTDVPSGKADASRGAAEKGVPAAQPAPETTPIAKPTEVTTVSASTITLKAIPDASPDTDSLTPTTSLAEVDPSSTVSTSTLVSPASSAATPVTSSAAPFGYVSSLPPEDDMKSLPKSVSFLDSDEDDANDFLFNPPAAAPAAAPFQRRQSQPPKSYVSFLDNNDVDEDELFAAALGQAAPAAPAPAASLRSQQPAKPASKSFLDSDDEDALFQPAAVNAKPAKLGAQSKVTKAEPAKLDTKAKPLKKTQLFDDSDDDDDLFGSKPAAAISKSQPAANISKSKPATSIPKLFPSSDEDEDQQSLHGKAKAKPPAKPSKSLFSDDEDDDDLFGKGAASKPAQAKPAARKVPPKPATKVAATATPLPASSSDIADNPLADLLGP